MAAMKVVAAMAETMAANSPFYHFLFLISSF
jgi:hypothetical protein